MKPLFRYLPLALAAFALHAQAQSVSPAYDAFRKQEATQPAPAPSATPATAQASSAPYVAPAPAREAPQNGGFFVGVQAGQGWIYDDVEQDAVAVNAGYRWQAGPWAQVGVELSGGRLDEATDGGWRFPKATYKAVGANARMNFGDSPWFATVRGGYFDAEQKIPGGGDFSTDGGYAGVAVGVDINRHLNVSLGYTAFVYADDYYYDDCDYYDDCRFNRADTVMLGIEARF